MKAKYLRTISLPVILLLTSLSGCSLIAPASPVLDYSSLYEPSAIRPLCEFRDVREDDSEVLHMMGLLKNVPDAIHGMVKKYGGKIIFVKKRITEYPELKPYQGKVLETRKRIGWDKPIDEMSAIYKSRYIQRVSGREELTGLIMIRIEFDPDFPPDILHEYGHMVDDLVGEEIYHKPVSETRPFIEMFKNTQWKDYSYGAFSPRELWAEIFTSFYSSKDLRERLKINYPQHYEFIVEWEKKAGLCQSP